MGITWTKGLVPHVESARVFEGAAAFVGGKLDQTATKTLEEGPKNLSGPVSWAGFEDHYFLAALVPSGHSLARKGRLGLVELCEHPIVTLPPGTGVRAVFDQDCTARGLQPNVTFQASAPDAVADLAARGLGVAVLSRTMAESYRPDLTVVPIAGLTTPALLALVWGKAKSPALRQLLIHAQRAFS